MPAGYGKRCEDCYWKQLLRKRITLSREAFSSIEMRARFDAFGHWLGKEVGDRKAAITINKFVSFFSDVDRTWQKIPDYGALLQHFGAEGLRRVRLPMRWLTDIGDITVDTKARENNSEQRRIENALAKIPFSSNQKKLLDGYFKILSERHENKRLSIRSLRLSLSPAVALLTAAYDEDIVRPTQRQLNALLNKSPGQRASISGFVAYLREHHDADLILPTSDPKRAKANRLKKLENEIDKLIQTPLNNEKSLRIWIEIALNYFHDVPRKTGRNLARSEDIIYSDDGYWIQHEKKSLLRSYSSNTRKPPAKRIEGSDAEKYRSSFNDATEKGARNYPTMLLHSLFLYS